ncbi:MAG: hypothetical protein RSC76_05240 [Oscillospiraceae bacterium]
MNLTLNITLASTQELNLVALALRSVPQEEALAQGEALSEISNTVAPVQYTPAPVVDPVAVQEFTQEAFPIQQPAPSAPFPAQVPTVSAPQYTLELLQAACAELLSAGKGAALQALLVKFQVTRLPDIKPDMYGVFATEIRALGARI